MKRCGYRAGLCSKPGACELPCMGFDDLKDNLKIGRFVRSCPYHVTVAGDGQLKLNLTRRRRDWDVGNPYNEGKDTV